MTALKHKLAALRVEALAGSAVAFAVAVAVAIALLPARGPAQAATVTLAPAKAAALINATSGAAAVDMRAIGDQARLINAALPFAGGPVLAARPFDASGSGDLDRRRALLCLTQAVYYEAGFEPVDGRRAVAQVVLNRMRHPAFPKSICGVVYQGSGTRVCQFTFVCDGALYRAPAASAWRVAEEVAKAALAGYVHAPVGGATHYHANYVAPRWAPLLAKVALIGQHIFYRWPGGWGQPGAFTGRYIGEPRDPLAMRPAPPALEPGKGLDEAAVKLAAGPPIPRAETDIGGLLDTTKGWTLSIPAPADGGSSAAKLIASQERKAAPQVAAATAAPDVASR